MSEQGVAGLSLGEVARRMGIRPPSLYVYFDSKNAVYDAVFARGWRLLRTMETLAEPDEATDLPAYLLDMANLFVRWTVEHPVYAQLMGWRPVPGYEPSPKAYEPAVVVLERGRAVIASLQALGLFTADVTVDELMRAWTIVTSGVITQQLANAPQEPFETGSFTSLLPQLVAMYRAHYAPRAHPHPRGDAMKSRVDKIPTTAAAAAPRQPALDRTVAMRLAAVEYDRVVAQLRSLGTDDWSRPTDCPAWDVRSLAAHMLGMAEMAASLREQMRQMRKARRTGGVFIDALTAVQVADQQHLTPVEIVERFAEVGPRAARQRRRVPGFVRRRAMPDAQPVGGRPDSPVERWTFGFLLDVILSRDPWMHRTDIAAATGAPWR